MAETSVRDFKLPDLGEGLEEGEIVEWHVEVGDVIELNATVASVETAKAIVDVPSPFAGTIVERVGDLGQTMEVGTVFLRIDVGGPEGAVAGDAPAPAGDDEAAQPDAEMAESASEDMVPSTGLDAESEPQPLVGYGDRGGGGGGRRRRRRGGDAAAQVEASEVEDAAVLAKPPVRKLARDLGVELASIAPGSGDGGVITRDDVRAAAAADIVATQAPVEQDQTEQAVSAPRPEPSAPAADVPVFTGSAGEKAVPGFRGRTPGEVEQVRGVRKRIIAKMEQSRREIPHALCRTDADLTELWEVRKQLTTAARAEGYDVKITPMALVMRATVLALRRFPTLNASFDVAAGEHGSITLHEPIHLGVAVDTDRGLMVPVIDDAHAKSTLQLAAEAAALAAKCRDGSITPGELTGGTFTVDNYGFFGNDDGNPIINTPEVGILGMGAIRERPWVVDGEIVARRVCSFTLAFDHRVADGGEAGRFTTYVAELCQSPANLLLHL
ncbi:dihydrolipoamide acetyltransferase family protein [Salsipaludibacter albus]|uniref:dihydrolipoamide acetyltransferase family protein n=1 Tax=Salsipaludibacter albus TaxID=2849650 RepID=UPI001EE48619|nr:dihydrolipoamide acetyltransferase family protein [Salsipaludibacter albus]MBY5164219.1 2-oxo acid dehydrogenase subunit E2 [Salsipaludibacter albus]